VLAAISGGDIRHFGATEATDPADAPESVRRLAEIAVPLEVGP
jgi:hypothetical protein